MDLSVDWLSCDPDACLVHGWDDGHVPETFRSLPPPATCTNDDHECVFDNNGRAGKAQVPSGPSDPGTQAGPHEGTEGISDIIIETGKERKVDQGMRTGSTTTSTTARTLLVWRPRTWHSSSSFSSRTSVSDNDATSTAPAAAVQIVDDALPAAVVEALYRVTIRHGEPSWGTYVPIDKVLNVLNRNINDDRGECTTADTTTNFNVDGDDNDPSTIDQLAALACSAYVRHALRKDDGLLRQILQREKVVKDAGDDESDSITSTLSQALHGVAVWALSSTTESSVSYHVDYAEQVRYCHNVVVLPHLAGTLHCSPVDAMVGGDLVVYDNFQHYERHGYKACKQPLPPLSEDASVAHVIPYQFNRMVIMAGHLPHASTAVESMLPENCRRVIVGFNVFGHDIGDIVQAAPEHSATWKRQVKLLRLQQCQANTKIPVSIQSISKVSPAVRKILVLAKRRKVQEEWRLEYLSNRLQEVLQDRESDGKAWSEPELVRRMLSHADSPVSSSWPTQWDVQRFLREHYFVNSKVHS